MKKFILLLFVIILGGSQEALGDVTYSAKSTVTNTNSHEVIRLDVLPVVKINTNPISHGIDASTTSTYVAPLIAPAQQQEKPTLNFNLNNIKNAKRGSILPDDNVNKTVSSVIQYFGAPYDKVFSHLLGVIGMSDLELVSYDTKSGRIFANYKQEKPIYITVSKYNSYNVMVKVTPADGIYDLPGTVTEKLFSNLNNSLAEK